MGLFEIVSRDVMWRVKGGVELGQLFGLARLQLLCDFFKKTSTVFKITLLAKVLWQVGIPEKNKELQIMMSCPRDIVTQRPKPPFTSLMPFYVHDALRWPKPNNPIYRDRVISSSRLEKMPLYGVSLEISLTAKHCNDTVRVAEERDVVWLWTPPKAVCLVLYCMSTPHLEYFSRCIGTLRACPAHIWSKIITACDLYFTTCRFLLDPE